MQLLASCEADVEGIVTFCADGGDIPMTNDLIDRYGISFDLPGTGFFDGAFSPLAFTFQLTDSSGSIS